MQKKNIITDLLAALTVSFAAIALGAAFGVMSGRGAFAGMIGAAVMPIFTGIFGGTRLNVSGPTAPMTAVSALVIAFAYDSFENDILAEQFITLVFILTGVFLLLASLFRLGKFISYVPNVIIFGFMSGISLLIWVDQFKVLFGIGGKTAPSGNLFINIILAIATFLFIILGPLVANKYLPKRISRFIPFSLSAIVIMTIITHMFNVDVGKIKLGHVEGTLAHLGELALSYIPTLEILTLPYLLKAVPYAIELCILGYLDSLLTALIMDNLTKEKTKFDKELFGQGLSNIIVSLCMGIPGAQATIRSVLLFKEGGKTRFSAVMVGIFALILFLAFKDYVTLVASSIFIGVLIKAALDVFEKYFLTRYFSKKWYRDKKRNIQFGFIVYTMLATAFIDLNFAVISGTLLFYIGKKLWSITDFVYEREDNKIFSGKK